MATYTALEPNSPHAKFNDPCTGRRELTEQIETLELELQAIAFSEQPWLDNHLSLLPQS